MAKGRKGNKRDYSAHESEKPKSKPEQIRSQEDANCQPSGLTSSFLSACDATASVFGWRKDNKSSFTFQVDVPSTASSAKHQLIDHPIQPSLTLEAENACEPGLSDSISDTVEAYELPPSSHGLNQWESPDPAVLDVTSAPNGHAEESGSIELTHDAAATVQPKEEGWSLVGRSKKNAYPNQQPPHLETNDRHDSRINSSSSPPSAASEPSPTPRSLPKKPASDAQAHSHNEADFRTQWYGNQTWQQTNSNRNGRGWEHTNRGRGKGRGSYGKYAKDGDLIAKNYKLAQDLDLVRGELRIAQDTIHVGEQELRTLRKDLAAAEANKMSAEARTKAGDLVSERMNNEVDGLQERIKQLEVQAAFSSIGDGSIDVPKQLNVILKKLVDLSEPLLDQLSEDHLGSSIKEWKGNLDDFPKIVSEFILLCQDKNAEIAVSLHYAIALLILCYIKCEIWNVAFHPVDPTCVVFDEDLGEVAKGLHGIYRKLVQKEPYIKSSNWRVMTYQTFWEACSAKLGNGSLADTLDHMANMHVDFVVKDYIPFLVTTSPMAPLKYDAFREILYEIIRDVLRLKHDAQTMDARYEYSLEIPFPPLENRQGLLYGSPICCKLPEYKRWEASSDARSPRVEKIQEQAKFHTAGDAGWVAKPKKG